MNMFRRNYLGATLASVILSATALIPAFAAELKPGDAFPSLKDAKLEGTLPDTAGKVVIVDFWASWCGPCKRALPILKELHQDYKDKGVVIVAVSLDESKADMDGYLKKNPLPFAILRDTKGQLAEKAHVEGIPATFILGPDGKVIEAHTGFSPSMKKDFSKILDAALAKK